MHKLWSNRHKVSLAQFSLAIPFILLSLIWNSSFTTRKTYVKDAGYQVLLTSVNITQNSSICVILPAWWRIYQKHNTINHNLHAIINIHAFSLYHNYIDIRYGSRGVQRVQLHLLSSFFAHYYSHYSLLHPLF